LSLFAGSIGISGSLDGPATTAKFNGPNGIATDSSGNIFVADSINQTVRKITPSGVVTTLAGTAGISGSTDATGVTASFNFNGHSSIATDSAGNVYVTDTNNHTIRKITSAGMVTTLAGTKGVAGKTDSNGTMASFNLPTGIATDSAGNVYVADSSHTIRKITPAGDVTTLAGTAGVPGSKDGAGTTASFYGPLGIATDSASNIYVSDNMNNSIRKITPAGDVSTLAGTAGISGSKDATGAAASFYRPDGVATDYAGNVYVADTNNNTIRKITAAGMVTTVVGTPGVTSFTSGALPGTLPSPLGISVSGTSLYITSGNGVAVVNNVP
jgi:sugar lactone lactonase YvrE